MQRFAPPFFLVTLVMLGSCSADSQPATLQLEVVAADYEWHIRYPGRDRLLQTDDDVLVKQHMAVPAQTDLEISLTSKDFIYTFRVPGLEQTKMAVPEIEFTLAFNSQAPGRYQLKGDQMCGFSHQSLIGDFMVMNSGEFQTWLLERQALEAIPEKASKR